MPFRPGDPDTSGLGPKATTDYFGPIPPQRCKVGDDCVVFTCDANYRSKIGIPPARARNVLGSWDADANLLTVVQFNLPANAASLPYVNSLWQMQDEPFAGDAVNSYNDGDPAGGNKPGAFYELETSSPAAELKPGGSIKHLHRTCHFAGAPEALNEVAAGLLGIDLRNVK